MLLPVLSLRPAFVVCRALSDGEEYIYKLRADSEMAAQKVIDADITKLEGKAGFQAQASCQGQTCTPLEFIFMTLRLPPPVSVASILKMHKKPN